MNDWNHDGKVDSKDYYFYKNYIDRGNSGSRSGKLSGGSHFFTVFIIAAIVAVFNELIGAAILLGYFYYEIFLKQWDRNDYDIKYFLDRFTFVIYTLEQRQHESYEMRGVRSTDYSISCNLLTRTDKEDSMQSMNKNHNLIIDYKGASVPDVIRLS